MVKPITVVRNIIAAWKSLKWAIQFLRFLSCFFSLSFAQHRHTGLSEEGMQHPSSGCTGLNQHQGMSIGLKRGVETINTNPRYSACIACCDWDQKFLGGLACKLHHFPQTTQNLNHKFIPFQKNLKVLIIQIKIISSIEGKYKVLHRISLPQRNFCCQHKEFIFKCLNCNYKEENVICSSNILYFVLL